MTAGLAVVGLGRQGCDLLRAAFDLGGPPVLAGCDPDPAALDAVARRWPGVRLTRSFEDVLADPGIDGVLLATPPGTRSVQAVRALEAGKHVLAGAPIASTSSEARALLDAAADHRAVLMPAHTGLYAPGVRKVGELLTAGELGELHFGTSSRVDLGEHRSGDGVVRALAPHDFAIVLSWLGEPAFVRAIGRDSIVPGTLDVAFVDLGFADGLLVHLDLSWLAPTPVSRTVLVGARKMVVLEEDHAEPVRIYDRGIDVLEPPSFGEYRLTRRTGEVVAPPVGDEDPVMAQLADFTHCVATGATPRASARLGLDVVRLVEATESSLLFNGVPTPLDAGRPERRPAPERRRRNP